MKYLNNKNLKWRVIRKAPAPTFTHIHAHIDQHSHLYSTDIHTQGGKTIMVDTYNHSIRMLRC